MLRELIEWAPMHDYIAKRIRELRVARGLSQAQLAARIGGTAQAVSNVERAQNLPTLELLRAIAIALEVPVQTFFEPANERDRKVEALLNAAAHLSDSELDLACRLVGNIRAPSS